MPRSTDTRGSSAAPAPQGAPAKKQGRIAQMRQVFNQTQKMDRTTLPWMLAALLVPIVLAVLIALLLIGSAYGRFLLITLGVMVGVLAAMFVLARKAERAAYGSIAGQPGAALAAMQSIRRGWNVDAEPCAIDPRSQDMVFRASGRAGVALVVENDGVRALKLLEKESNRLARVLPNVPVHQIVVGEDTGTGQVPLPKLASHLMRMRPTLTKDEAAQVAKRLHAMPSAIRQAMPKGIDPMRARPDRRAMRGR